MSEHSAPSLPVLALTGTIATGKSTVARMFQAHGALVLSADQVSRELLEPWAAGWLALRGAFADRFFGPEGRLERASLRAAIFTDPALRARVNQLLHPLVRLRIKERIDGTAPADWPQVRQLPAFRGIVVEVPLLFEAGWQGDYHGVLVVSCTEEQAVSRLLARDGASRPEALAALAAQLPLTDKVARGDLVIDNGGELAGTQEQVANAVERLNRGEVCRRG